MIFDLEMFSTKTKISAIDTIKNDETPETLKLLIKSINSSLKLISLISDSELFIKNIIYFF